MKEDNFFASLENYYEVKYSPEQINRMKKWFGNKGIQERHLDNLFDDITASFKTYKDVTKPLLEDLVKAFKNCSIDSSSVNKSLVKQRAEIIKMDERDIVKMMKNIRYKFDRDGELSPLEIDALCDWDEMRIECDAMAEHKMSGTEIKIHMDNMKKALSTGAKFNSIFYRINALNLPRPDKTERGMHNMEDAV